MAGDICRGADAWPGCPLQQRLIKGVQNLIQLKNVVKPICDKYSMMISNLLLWDRA